ncbi:MAG: hypothetical protein V4753_12415 [Pseudomonadota bacterium]
MCDCGKPSANEAKSEAQSGHAETLTGDKNHAHATHAAHAATTDAACSCGPSAHDHHTTHADATKHA